jgi:hypothetical protein
MNIIPSPPIGAHPGRMSLVPLHLESFTALSSILHNPKATLYDLLLEDSTFPYAKIKNPELSN